MNEKGFVVCDEGMRGSLEMRGEEKKKKGQMGWARWLAKVLEGSRTELAPNDVRRRQFGNMVKDPAALS